MKIYRIVQIGLVVLFSFMSWTRPNWIEGFTLGLAIATLYWSYILEIATRKDT